MTWKSLFGITEHPDLSIEQQIVQEELDKFKEEQNFKIEFLDDEEEYSKESLINWQKSIAIFCNFVVLLLISTVIVVSIILVIRSIL